MTFQVHDDQDLLIYADQEKEVSHDPDLDRDSDQDPAWCPNLDRDSDQDL